MTINGMMDAALIERGDSCGMSRLPTGRYPLFSESIQEVIPAGSDTTTTALQFVASRDTLFTDLSVTATDADGNVVEAYIYAEYCGTKYLDRSSIAVWKPCCQRKPLWLVGVNEDKKLNYSVKLAAPAPLGGVTVTVSQSGFQGTGCCG